MFATLRRHAESIERRRVVMLLQITGYVPTGVAVGAAGTIDRSFDLTSALLRFVPAP